jgi:hypothetical protein
MTDNRYTSTIMPWQALQEEALELELISLDTQDSAGEAIKPPASTPNIAEAFTLVLRAHCERGDVSRALGIVAALRDRGRPLPLEAYSQLAALVRRTRSLKPVLAVSPVDVFASLAAEIEPLGMSITNRIGIEAAALGTTERAMLAGVIGCSAVATLVTPPPSPDAMCAWMASY